MGQTPDRFPGEREDESILLYSGSTHPTHDGEIVYVTGMGFRFMEEGAEKGLTGSGVSEAQHKTLRQLIHFVDDGPAEGFASGAYKETTPAGPFPTLEVWWESAAKLKKIVQLATTWTGPNITQEQWKVFDVDGSTCLATVTDSISYSGAFEASRTRTITVP
jgi:hypothetical protein